MRIHFIIFFMLLTGLNECICQALPKEFEMGKPAEIWKADSKDISNPQSWDETAFQYNKPVIFFGETASEVSLTFYKDRLFYIHVASPASWETVKQSLDTQYGKPWIIDTTSAEKSGSWGDPKNGVTVYEASNGTTSILFTDDTQKEFKFSDLFKGMLLWLIIVMVGLFVVYYLIVSLITSYCKGCKTFNMKLQSGVEFSGPKDHSSNLFETSIHYDKTYKYKCSKCGSLRKDKYSGFWQYQQRKN